MYILCGCTAWQTHTTWMCWKVLSLNHRSVPSAASLRLNAAHDARMNGIVAGQWVIHIYTLALLHTYCTVQLKKPHYITMITTVGINLQPLTWHRILVRERSALADPYCQSTWMSVGLCVCPQLWGQISRKTKELGDRLLWAAYRKVVRGYQMVTSPMTSRDPMTS